MKKLKTIQHFTNTDCFAGPHSLARQSRLILEGTAHLSPSGFRRLTLEFFSNVFNCVAPPGGAVLF